MKVIKYKYPSFLGKKVLIALIHQHLNYLLTENPVLRDKAKHNLTFHEL